MRGKYVSYVWFSKKNTGKDTFDIMINVRPCTMTGQSHSVAWELCKICLWEETLQGNVVLGICSLLKN